LAGCSSALKTQRRWAVGIKNTYGVSLTPSSYGELPWRQEVGPTAFSPFPRGELRAQGADFAAGTLRR